MSLFYDQNSRFGQNYGFAWILRDCEFKWRNLFQSIHFSFSLISKQKWYFIIAVFEYLFTFINNCLWFSLAFDGLEDFGVKFFLYVNVSNVTVGEGGLFMEWVDFLNTVDEFIEEYFECVFEFSLWESHRGVIE